MLGQEPPELTVPGQESAGFLVQIDNLVLKSSWKIKGPRMLETTLKRAKFEDYPCSISALKPQHRVDRDQGKRESRNTLKIVS